MGIEFWMASIVAPIVITVIGAFVSYWVNKRKTETEINELIASTEREIAQLKREQLLDLSETYKGVSQIISKMQTFEIESEDYYVFDRPESRLASNIYKNHELYLNKLRQIKADILVAYIDLDEHFDAVITGIEDMAEQITWDGEDGQTRTHLIVDGNYDKNGKEIIEGLEFIINKIKALIKVQNTTTK